MSDCRLLARQAASVCKRYGSTQMFPYRVSASYDEAHKIAEYAVDACRKRHHCLTGASGSANMVGARKRFVSHGAARVHKPALALHPAGVHRAAPTFENRASTSALFFSAFQRTDIDNMSSMFQLSRKARKGKTAPPKGFKKVWNNAASHRQRVRSCQACAPFAGTGQAESLPSWSPEPCLCPFQCLQPYKKPSTRSPARIHSAMLAKAGHATHPAEKRHHQVRQIAETARLPLASIAS